MTFWNPVGCVLHLNFCATATRSSIIEAGHSYAGSSIITYRKENLDPVATTTTAPPTAYSQFLAHLAEIGAQGGLHLHACTRFSASLPQATPLQVLSYKVNCRKPLTPLKVITVVEEDMGGDSGQGDAKETSDMRGKATIRGKSKKTGASSEGCGHGEGPPPEIGSKVVLFDQANALLLGAEVELTVTFTGTVQPWCVGGIYAPSGRGKRPDQPILLTHFEVALAKYAFPCPDHPQYRLAWELRSLQLPAMYHTILTNGVQIGKKGLASQMAVQYSFSRVGVLPAYLLAFAAFAGDALDHVEGTLEVPLAAAYAEDATTDVVTCIPVRVLCTKGSGITSSTLHRTMRILVESVRLLQDFFHCPLPLCECPHLQLLFVPTMPYISGMEHHGCIFLNEAIFCEGGKAKGSQTVQTELIVHEVTHHWAGNAVGLPFPVKEGICQVLEQCFGDVILGKPMRKVTALSVVEDHIQDTEKGKEFTGHSYQYAHITIQNIVAENGFARFQIHMQQLMRAAVLEPAAEEETMGGREVMLLSGAPVPKPTYLSTEEFMHRMTN